MINGKEEITFTPNPQMMVFGFARCEPTNFDKKDADVLSQVNIPTQNLSRWRREYDPYFDEWLENFIMIHSNVKLLKNMLESVGIKKAMQGDFSFWKAIAIKYGVISSDTQNLNVIPVNLQNYDQWTPEQIESQRNSLLQNLLPMADEGGVAMADAAAGQGSESGSPGAAPLP